MGIKQLYSDNLRKLPNEYGDVSVMTCLNGFLESKVGEARLSAALHACIGQRKAKLFLHEEVRMQYKYWLMF